MKSLLLGVGLALLSISAAEAIDCAEATTPIDTAICNSPDALKADAAMGDAYAAALKLLGAKDAKALKADQANWLDLRSDCLTTYNGGDAAEATPEQLAQCLTDTANDRAAYLSGTPAEGPGTKDRLVPVVFFGIDEIFNHTLRFLKPVGPAAKAFDKVLDTELKDIHTATTDGDTSDSFDMILRYASPALISAQVDVYLDGPRYAHPMPYRFSINIGTDKGGRLIMSDMLDAAGIKAVEDICIGELKDFIAEGTEGADTRRGDVDTMAKELDLWSFGARQATLTYLDYFTQDDPPTCTVAYDVLRPLIKSGFPLPA